MNVKSRGGAVQHVHHTAVADQCNLLAGVLVGPFTPGFTADQHLAAELSEIGVILLMFGVGLHFSLNDLLSVKAIAIPGALAQIAIATVLGMGLAWMMGWPFASGIVFGLALSVASTVVLLRALQERRLVDSEQGHIAVGWLIVEDIFMVLALVLLPALAGLMPTENAVGPEEAHNVSEVIVILGITTGKIVAFIAIMLIAGRRIIPWVLHYAFQTGSREMFRLTVLATALGVAYGSALLFDVSFALGAFFAGIIMSESELSQQAAEESLPLRDAFAVLFFVSVGMLFNPMILIESPLPLLATLLIIVVGKSIGAFLIVMAFRHPVDTALIISASLAQIGEFSFILAGLGLSIGILPEEAHDLILAGAILSIFLNPVMFVLVDKIVPYLERHYGLRLQGAGKHTVDVEIKIGFENIRDHAVIVGFGRVGHLVAESILKENHPLLVIEERPETAAELRERGIASLLGNASTPGMLEAANIKNARWLFVAMPNVFEAGQILNRARTINPNIEIITRAHSTTEVDHLKKHGAKHIVMGEQEIARAMLAEVFGTAPRIA